MIRRHRNEDDTEINLTPMLDVTFIMLIFFIVTTSFVREIGIDVSKPSNQPQSEPDPKNRPIVVAIRDNGTIWMDRRELEVGAVRANVEQARARSPQGAVVVLASRSAKTGILVSVMDQAKQAGVDAISVAATK